MYNIYTRTSVPQDKANTRHARFLPLSNSFDRVCLRCNLTLFTRRIKSCTGVFGLQDLASDFFRKGIFIESTQAEKYAQNSSLARNFIPGYFDRIFILSISSRVRTQRIFEMQWNNKRFSKLNNLKNISTRNTRQSIFVQIDWEQRMKKSTTQREITCTNPFSEATYI